MSHTIDTMIFVDEKINDNYGEFVMLGSATSWQNPIKGLSDDGLAFSSRPTIKSLMKAICEFDKPYTWKLFALESFACDFSLVAIELGFLVIDKK